MDEERFSKIAGIFPTQSEISDFNPGRPRKLTLFEAFDDYDLSHDKLRYSDIEDEDEDPVVDSTIDDDNARHMLRLAKSMGVVLDPDERGLNPIELVDRRLQKLSDVISKIESQSDSMVSDPWENYVSPQEATSLLNRFENQIGDAVHLVIRFQPDVFDDIVQYFQDCSHEGGELSRAAQRVMSSGTRGINRGTVFDIVNREKIKRSPATGALGFSKKMDESFIRSMYRSQMIDKLNE